MVRRSLETTLRISCEAVPASALAGAGMRRHLDTSNGAAESFVSFIRLFGGSTSQPLRDDAERRTNDAL